MEVFDKELIITYDIDGTLIELYGSTNKDNTFKFSILDTEQNKVTGGTELEVNDLKSINEAIKHFTKEFKKLTES